VFYADDSQANECDLSFSQMALDLTDKTGYTICVLRRWHTYRRKLEMTTMTSIAARLIDLAAHGADPDGGRSMTLEELEASFAEHEKNFPEEPESERSLEERAREEASRVPLTPEEEVLFEFERKNTQNP
jgi:hypothetical protein